MRTIKQALIVLLVLLVAGHIASYFYLGSSERKVPPTMHCPEDILEVSASDKESVLLQGITASDPQDGDLTNRIVISGISKLVTSNTAKVTYIVFDSDDNMASCIRRIRYTDYHRPQFEIVKPLTFAAAKDVSLLDRIVATDVVDGDISSQLRVSTLATTDNSEVYDITIQVTNSMGDTAWLQLPVLVQGTNPLRPVIELNSYLIYLDQGSSFDAASYLKSVTVSGNPEDVSAVGISSNVNTEDAGTYRVMYTYSANGSTGTAILTVVVQ